MIWIVLVLRLKLILCLITVLLDVWIPIFYILYFLIFSFPLIPLSALLRVVYITVEASDVH